MKKHQEPTDKYRLNHLTGAERAEASITPNSPVVMPEKCEMKLDSYKKAVKDRRNKNERDK